MEQIKNFGKIIGKSFRNLYEILSKGLEDCFSIPPNELLVR